MRRIVQLFTMLLLSFHSSGQHFELGYSIGLSNYLGDLAPSNLLVSLGESYPATGIFSKYNFNDRLALRGALSFGRIGSSDAHSNNSDFRKIRNLNFRTDIFELALIGEFNLLRYQPYQGERIFSPYIFGGIAVYSFNPKTFFEGEWYDLQALGTEGQGITGYPNKYKRTQISIPFGAGIKYMLLQRLNIGIEIGLRKTFTDYLDDTSNSYPDLVALAATNGQLAAELSWRTDDINEDAIPPTEGQGRGDPSDLDWYIFTKFSISYNFFNFGNSKKRYRPTKLKCPVF
ncbi:MAG: hypothetical protein ACI8P3_002429 [Saprospiraceae bacterium]|jgi:hypothetical protein